MTDLRLVPVVELEPGDFQTREHAMPPEDVEGAEESAGWRRYWFESLADSGIHDLEPVGSTWCVRLEEVCRSAHLAEICAVSCSDVKETGDIDEEVPALPGGFVLFEGEQGLVHPACCGALEDWSDWQAAADTEQSEWQMLWIGHPWVSIRSAGESIEFSPPHETTSTDLDVAFAVDRSALRSAVQQARAQLESFARDIESAVRPRFGSSARRVAERLLGLRDA